MARGLEGLKLGQRVRGRPGKGECDKSDMKDTRVHQEDKEAAGQLAPGRCSEIVFLHGRGTKGRGASLFLAV